LGLNCKILRNLGISGVPLGSKKAFGTIEIAKIKETGLESQASLLDQKVLSK
jgi:hypothetical protein